MIANWVKNGSEFNQANPAEVEDFLRSRSLTYLEQQPDRLHLTDDGRSLLLQISNGTLSEYPLRRSFLYKLLRWFSFPLNQLHRLTIETVTSVANDYLLNIRSRTVTVVVENGDALTITSNRFSRLPDLDVLDLSRCIGVELVSRNDFFMRLYSEIRYRKEIVKGDICGFGYNLINSETGFRKISIHHYILRYVCSNGAVVRIDPEGDQRVHYDHDPIELKQWLAQRLKNGEVRRDQIVRSLEKIRAAKGPIDKEPLSRKLNAILGKRSVRVIMKRIEDCDSLFDVFDVITSEAKRFDVGRRLQVEAIAGDLLIG